MKNRMKTIVAFLCVLTLSVGAMAAWMPGKEVKATDGSTTTGNEVVYLEGFKNVTLSSFKTSAGVQMEDIEYSSANDSTNSTAPKYYLRDINGLAIENFDQTLISFKVKFSYTDSNKIPMIQLGGYRDQAGFAIQPSSSGKTLSIIQYNQATYPLVNQNTVYSLARVVVNPDLYSSDSDVKHNLDQLGKDFLFSNGKEFLLQLSFEYYDSDSNNTKDALKLGVYINGKPVKLTGHSMSITESDKIDTDGKLLITTGENISNHGTNFGFVNMAATNSIKLTSVIPENENVTPITWSDFVATKAVGELAYLDGFKHVTLSDFTNSGNVLKENTAYSANTEAYSLKDITGTTMDNLDNTLVSFNIQYNYDSNIPYILIGGNAKDRGIAIYPSGTGKTLNFVNYNKGTQYRMITGEHTSGAFARVNVDQAYSGGLDETATTNATYNVNQLKQGDTYFNFKNTRFLLQLSFDYYDSDENGMKDKLKLGVYINGKPMKLEFADKSTTDKDYATIDTDGNVHASVYYYDVTDEETNVTTSTSNHGTYIQLTNMTTGGSLTLSSPKITLPNKAFLKSGQVAYKLQDSDTITQLGNTSFEGNVTFLSATDDDMIYYGGGGSGYGLRFSACESGEQLKLCLGDAEVYLDATTAGVPSFVDNEFQLKITTEYANYDGDEDSNDIQLGIYINGKLYNNRYLYAYDYTTATDEDNTNNLLAGNYVTIYSDESNESNSKGIMVRSVSDVVDVTYDLAGDAYTADAITTAFGIVTEVRLGETVVEVGDGLTLAGDYTLYNGEELVGELVLYKAGDVHLDNVTDVRDLVAMKKVNANIDSTTWAATMGAYKADFSETTICNIILGIETQ